MSYPLYRIHWEVLEISSRREMFSYHKDDSMVAEFIIQVHREHGPDSRPYYRQQGPGKEIRTHDGNLYNEVMKSTELGVWREIPEKVSS